jgi:hypothetical protein
MSNIHNYPLTATVINDEDYYDVDFWNGVSYESRKISGATLKALLGGGAEELNDLTDVTTGLPVTPTNADDGRVLYFDVDTGQWISDDIANIANVVKDCKTSTGNTIPKGTAVYLAGYDNDLLVVEPCDNTDPNKMPCIGITAEVLDDTNAKKVVSFGKLQGMDTSAFSDGDELYVGTAGGFVTTRPTGAVDIQRVAVVLKSDATGGQIKVFNTSRTAGLPNLSDGTVWVGNSDSHPVEVLISSFLNNIYNSDGTLTGNRNVIAAGFYLQWLQLNNLLYQVTPATSGVPAWEIDVDTSNMAGGDAIWKLRDIIAGIDRISVLASGAIVLNGAYALPAVDGNAGDVMTTDGAGGVTFQPPAAAQEKHIDTFYAYDMSPSPSFTWNGVTVGNSALTTVGSLNGVRFQGMVGTGQPDGCYVNTACPSYYVNGDDINLNLSFSTDGTGGDVKIFVGIQTPNTTGAYGDDTTTTWLSYTWTAAAGYPIEKATVPFGGVGLNLNAGDPLVIKIYRDPSDAADTYSGEAYINTIGVEIG